MLRSAMRQRMGNRRSGGMSRSAKLALPRPAGAADRIACAGLIREAERAGPMAASSITTTARINARAIVSGAKRMSLTGTDSISVYKPVMMRPSIEPRIAPGIAPASAGTKP